MADEKNTVKTGGTDEKPKDEKNLTADGLGTPTDPAAVKKDGADLKTGEAEKTAAPAAVKDGEAKDPPGKGAKITGITFIKGGADKTVEVTDSADEQKKEAEILTADFAAPAAQDKKNPDKSKAGKTDQTPAGGGASGKDGKPKEKQTRAARPTDGIKKEKVIDFGGAGGTGSTPQDRTAAMAKAAIEKAAAPPPPKEAQLPGEPAIIGISDLYPFKDHPFQVRDDADMKNLVASVGENGIRQPIIVRPRDEGGYEVISGHRRQRASELAGYKEVPCIVCKMTDEEAILAMTESNFNQRDKILPSERAAALKMQLDAIKRQGARFKGVASGDVDKRSNEIVADKNGMQYKTVQRFVALNNLVPELAKLMDAGKVGTTTVGYQLSFLKPKNQKYIAAAIEAETPTPTEEKVKRMRDLESKNMLNGDTIDGIMLDENKKEERKVTLTGQELDKYFSAEKTPADMKATILRALDEYKEKQPLEFGKPEKKKDDISH